MMSFLGEGYVMKNKILATLGTAALALSMSASASFAGYFQPGETMGVSLVSPLPEGVFFADLTDYGRSDIRGANLGVPGASLGVNIPVFIWSTPYTFYNTRLEFFVALPFVRIDGGGADRLGAFSYAAGPALAHDFGGGLTGGFLTLFRTPDPSQDLSSLPGAAGGPTGGRTEAGFDVRQSLQYIVPTNGSAFGGFGGGLFNGLTFIENAGFSTSLGNQLKTNDLFAGDLTIEKSFGKFTIGFTGFGALDTQNRILSGGRATQIEIGGLIAYDFGPFSLTGIVTRSVLQDLNGEHQAGGFETRGWLRLIAPLYVAPTAPVVKARY